MSPEWKTTILLLIAVASPLISWLVADARSKARSVFTEEKVAEAKAQWDTSRESHESRIAELELNAARSAQDRLDIRRVTDRLDTTKASKELVDGFRSEIQSIRADMDKRFDRLERILERRDTLT